MKFSEDVEQILREHGRCEFRESLMLGDCVTCGQPSSHERHSIPPTRQQIIEEAVRLWASQARLCCDECGETAGHRPNPEGIEETSDRFVKVAGPAFEGVDLKTYMDEVRER